MTQTSLTRQPKGIPVGGQFAATAHGEPDLTLRDEAQAGLSPDTVIAHAASSIGPGIIPALEDQVTATSTPGGRELLLQCMDSRYNPASEFNRISSYGGLKPEECDQLAGLGYTSVNEVAGEAMKRFSGVSSVIRNGVDPERLQVLGQLKTNEHQWSAWEKDAYLNAPVTELDGVLGANHASRADAYVRTVALLGEDKAARAGEAIALKIGDRGLIEATDHGLEDLKALRDTLPEAKRNAMHIVGLADRGITGHHLKTYGARACDRFSAVEMDAAGLPPAVIRSLAGAGVGTDLVDFRKLHSAGYTKGADVKDASRAMGTTDIRTLIKARKHATGEQMAVYKNATRKDITVVDAQAIGRLAKAGISEPDQLKAWTGAVHSTANWDLDRNQSILAIHADIIEAGITPDKLGEMTRAGIPVDEAGQYTDTADLWTAGQKFRDTYDAAQTRKVQTKWIREATPWAFTEDTYRTGDAQ
ncbi:hypothetical protein IV500_05820 [Paeniglutamicibacter antarcticus]|uniref:Uncharacterized protein n=1 Tax=Arthrobacter terrae TaxID=2935737 RepID=A0A931G4Y7_9MICC|nr:hypothetical protein [Arthrobacter terrae]MBG0738940.1 hypothetical protein [Arthrobacter terrae]